MTRDEAVELLGRLITYEQGPYRYARGSIVGIVDRPSVVIEDATGFRFVFALESVKNPRLVPSHEEMLQQLASAQRQDLGRQDG